VKISHIFATLGIAAILAAVVSFVITPKLDGNNASLAEADAVEATPFESQSPEPGATRRTARISVRPDGHYWARTLVNNKASVEFMVDTGASVVALTFEDARRMGLNPSNLDYKWKISTAGGETMGASVTIDSIRINQVHIRDVQAMVLRADLEQSLLGMSYLNKLYSYEFRGERLIIRQ